MVWSNFNIWSNLNIKFGEFWSANITKNWALQDPKVRGYSLLLM